MFEELSEDGVCRISDAMEALSELERNTTQAIMALRSSERLEIRTRAWLRPGNSSQRAGSIVEGLTADISSGGCMLLTSCPVMAGDIFWLRFSDEYVRIDPLLVRCIRCRFVREDAFEVGIRFLRDIELVRTAETTPVTEPQQPRTGPDDVLKR